MDFTPEMFDFANVTDMPETVQKEIAKPVRTRGPLAGPSEDQTLVTAILAASPALAAMTPMEVLIVVLRAKKLTGEAAEALKEGTVRGWLNRALARGMIAKATGRKGFCALTSPDVQTAEEAAAAKAKSAQMVAARKAKAEAAPGSEDVPTPKAPETPQEAAVAPEAAKAEAKPVEEAPVDPLAALGLGDLG